MPEENGHKHVKNGSAENAHKHEKNDSEEKSHAHVGNGSEKESSKQCKNSAKNGRVQCCYKDSEGRLNAVFCEENGKIEKTELKNLGDGNYKSHCTCGDHHGKLCSHATAALAYYSRFENDDIPAPLLPDAPSKYAGLKYESFSELLTKALNPPQAELFINAESEFPHVPSKWERALLSVTLRYKGREYLGNLSNLRQLHFGKAMAASLSVEYFSQQDRQIIRYLSINADPEDSKLALDSEKTAEFFHCLSGFKRFVRKGEQIVVHKEIAEPIMVCKKCGLEYILSPAAMIEGSVLPMKLEKVITGRSGCWLGIAGEYWWMPAFVDVAWLRSFLRASEQRCDEKSAQLLMSGRTGLPVRVIEHDLKDLTGKKCKVLFNAVFSSENTFDMEVAFNYDGKTLPADGGRLFASGGDFCMRENEKEKAVISALQRFGFEYKKPENHACTMHLTDVEPSGLFMDELMPNLLKSIPEIYLSSSFGAMCSGGNGVPELKLTCKLSSQTNDFYELTYKLYYGNHKFTWDEVHKSIKHNRTYVAPSQNSIIKISSALRKFIKCASNIITIPDEKQNIIKIPRFSAPYWAEAAQSIPDAVPHEFIGAKNYLNDLIKESDAAKLFSEEGGDEKMKFKFEGSLRNYQKQGVCWMKELSNRGYNLILADEMGLGKTIQTLALMSILEKDAPFLILCPSSLVENWHREAVKFVPTLKAVAVTGHERHKIWKHYHDYDLMISSYALAKRDIEYISECSFEYLILDEAQHIKNPFTVNAKSCKMIKSKHRIVLTGTPLENSSEDLWSILDFLHPGLLGNFNAFKNNYSGIHKDKDKQDDLAARVSPFILRRKKKDVYAELPPKIEQVLYCEMDNGQKALYESFLEKGREQLNLFKGNKEKSRFKILTALLRLRQICCHPNLLPQDIAGIDIKSAKMELLQELLFENIDSGHKILLFSQFTSLLKIIRGWLDEEKIRYEYLDGSTVNRLDHVDNFNKHKDIPVFLLSLKAGGTGLNLTSADTVIIYDPWWNPAVEAQAADRSHRIGQTMPVNSIKLVVKNSIEEKILELQQRKQHIFNSLIENPSHAMKHFDMTDLEYLFK